MEAHLLELLPLPQYTGARLDACMNGLSAVLGPIRKTLAIVNYEEPTYWEQKSRARIMENRDGSAATISSVTSAFRLCKWCSCQLPFA